MDTVIFVNATIGFSENLFLVIFTNESLSINKNIQSGSRNLPQCSPSRGCFLHIKSIPVTAMA